MQDFGTVSSFEGRAYSIAFGIDANTIIVGGYYKTASLGSYISTIVAFDITSGSKLYVVGKSQTGPSYFYISRLATQQDSTNFYVAGVGPNSDPVTNVGLNLVIV